MGDEKYLYKYRLKIRYVFLGTAGFYSSSLRGEKKSMFSVAESAIQSAIEPVSYTHLTLPTNREV